MPVIFQNPGLIDLRAVQIMGLHAKDSKNPIGQFGTGLKYAIAVLLRNNCQINIFRGEENNTFLTKKEHFREKEFDFVYMISEGKEPLALGFTLELGKHWEPWMAIRELESNVRDEGGTSFCNEDWQLSPNTTTIVITGTTAEQEYAKLHDIFITTKPLWSNSYLEVHSLANPEQGKWLYYRGVRTKPLEKPCLFRYNILEEVKLTEDRTFKYSWEGNLQLRWLGNCTREDIIRAVVLASNGKTEFDIQFSEYILSEEFTAIVSALGPRANGTAWKAVRMAKGFPEFEDIPMDEIQKKMLERAVIFIEKMGEKRIREYTVFLASDLGANKLGKALPVSKQIWLSTRVFEMGMKQLISCLYEEYIHLDRKLEDLNYEMQNFLFDQIITQVARLQGEIL